MKKFLLVSVIVVFLLTTLIAFLYAYKNIEENKKIIRKNYKSVDLDLGEGEMLSWIDDENILVNKNNYLTSLNLDSKKENVIFSERYKSDGNFDCFLPNGGIFNRKSVSNWNNPIVLGKFNIEESDSVNRVDCSVRKYGIDMPKEIQFDGETYDTDFGNENIFSNQHGISRSYHKYFKERIGKVIFIKNGDSEKYVDLGFFRDNPGILSTFDDYKKEYLLYTGGDDAFGIDKAWIVDSNLNIIKKIEIPSGPWMEDYSFIEDMFYDMKCFSCGCSCYRNADIFMRNGKIYIQVWGKAVKKKYRGIYQLNKENSGWKKIIDMEIYEDAFFSPDGCKIAYVNKGKMKLMNTCK
ncbi:MAG TPA: hypothetical protein DDY52_00320 [Candidatus Moranbacteria bacterium]|nr:MAG: hypothetical protein UR51_C0004G0064 [Candidatus Moranbacteria bacterium GW2011_GWF1_34_10]HBI16593.1 hypothetical protein [Candidatus Moranbacteria bacterium]